MDLTNIDPKSYIFWPVGTGDSTTIKLENNFFIQIDFRHTKKSEDVDEDAYPIDEELKKLLPKKDGKSYLDVFILTHPDKDHIQGFEEFHKQVTIGELWFSPKIFGAQKDLCADAEYFKDVVDDRIQKLANGNIDDNRIRVIGYDDVLNSAPYDGISDDYKSIPGQTVKIFNGSSFSFFELFIHAPFKDLDDLRDKNNTSLGFQTLITCNSKEHRALFFGDMEDDQLEKVFNISVNNDSKKVEWNLLLAPHHCSKNSLYYKDGDNEKVNEKLIEHLKSSGQEEAYIISSSEDNFTDTRNSNPPSLKAKNQYKKLIKAKHFLCTHSNKDKSGNIVPIIVNACSDEMVKLAEGYSGFASASTITSNPAPSQSNEFGK